MAVTDPSGDDNPDMNRFTDLAIPSATVEPPSASRSRVTYFAIAAAIVGLVGAGGWFSGVQYARLHSQQIVSDAVDVQKDTTGLRVQLDAANAEILKLRRALELAGAQGTAAQIDTLQKKLLHDEAELNNFKTLLARDQKANAQNQLLLRVLSTPGVRLIPLESFASAENAVAYAVLLDKSEVILVGSKLPKPSAGREYQLWLHRNDDPKVVNGGVVTVDDSDRAVYEFRDAELVSEIAGISVTEESAGGSDGPAGTKVFASAPDE